MKAGNFYMTDSPEAMGVDVAETLRKKGIMLEWPCVSVTYKVSFAGTVRPDVLDSMCIRGRRLAVLEDGFLSVQRQAGR
jgi:hypothetical protein